MTLKPLGGPAIQARSRQVSIDTRHKAYSDIMTSSDREKTTKRTRSVVLVGFSGSGKTTVSHLLAEQLSWSVVDTDAAVVASAGIDIASLFADRGEQGFRALEAETCLAAAQQRKTVIATGAGALLREDVRAAFQARCDIIVLDVTLETAWQRLKSTRDRPLLTGPQADATSYRNLATLYAARAGFYASFRWHIDANGATPQDVCEELMRILSTM